jgi:phage repressor protein C with HTH and peptisase S24 domain
MDLYGFLVQTGHMKVSRAATGLKRLRERAKMSVREVAEAIDRPPSTYASYEDKYKKDFLPVDLVRDLAAVFAPRGIDSRELYSLAGLTETGSSLTVNDTPAPDGFTPIGRFDTSFSMGPGSLVVEDPEPLGYWLFESQWLRAISAANSRQLAVVKVDGDSMQPTLMPGDWVLIDRTKIRPTREGIYAIRVGDQAWVKRISLNIKTKQVRILSDNPTTPPQPEMDEEEVAILGRVIALVARRIA